MQPALADSSGWVRLRKASDWRAMARRLIRHAVGDAKVGSDHDLARAVQPAVVVAELHVRNRDVDDTPVERRKRDALDELADQIGRESVRCRGSRRRPYPACRPSASRPATP